MFQRERGERETDREPALPCESSTDIGGQVISPLPLEGGARVGRTIHEKLDPASVQKINILFIYLFFYFEFLFKVSDVDPDPGQQNHQINFKRSLKS